VYVRAACANGPPCSYWFSELLRFLISLPACADLKYMTISLLPTSRWAMQRSTLDLLLLGALVGALATAFLWGLRPVIQPVFMLYPMGWTQADLIRHIWHFRLVQPEWLSHPEYLPWAFAETYARLGAIFTAWVAAWALLIYQYLRRGRRQA
jgi:hypothetical protein